jgi:hypothetical protein
MISSATLTEQQLLQAVGLPSAVILVAYTLYTALFGLKRSAFRNWSVQLHNIPGLMIALVGTALWLYLGYELASNNAHSSPGRVASVEQRSSWFLNLFHLWLIGFVTNTLTGFCMIPLLPNVDPAVKREFTSLVLCQICFVPVILGQLDPANVVWCRRLGIMIAISGFVVSLANLVLYSMDYIQGRSNTVCSSKYLVDQMEKQKAQRIKRLRFSRSSHQQSTAALEAANILFHDYIAICFQRGSEQTRMPANRVMLFIAVTLVVPFLFIGVIALRLETLHATYPPEHMNAVGLFMLLIMCTVGNMQVFHGTVAVRGHDTVARASAMVALTVVFEMILVFAMYAHVQGYKGFADFNWCILTNECVGPLSA